MKIIDRYIIREFLPPFFLGLLLFTFVLLLNRIFKLTDLIVNKGVSLVVVLKLITYILPSFFTLTIPMAVLLAALVAFGRLTTDSEIIALKTTGFSLYRLMAPVMALAAIAFLVTSYFSLYLAPLKARTFKRDLFILAKTRGVIGIDEGVFNDSFKNVVIYTNEAPSSDEMRGVFISDERNPDEPYVIIAKKGKLEVDPARGFAILSLENGSIHKRGAGRKSYEEITFDSNTLSISLYDKLFSEDEIKRSKREMTLAELKEESVRLKSVGENPDLLMTEYYQRFSLPMACLLFGLVGPPLGLYSRRSGRSAGMSIALGIFALYYVMMQGGTNIASGGVLPPLAVVVLPNIVIGGLGVYILLAAAKERPVDLAGMVMGVYRMVRGKRRAKRTHARAHEDHAVMHEEGRTQHDEQGVRTDVPLDVPGAPVDKVEACPAHTDVFELTPDNGNGKPGKGKGRRKGRK